MKWLIEILSIFHIYCSVKDMILAVERNLSYNLILCVFCVFVASLCMFQAQQIEKRGCRSVCRLQTCAIVKTS